MVLVSVDELQKVVTDSIRDKLNPQEPPSSIPLVTQVQPSIQTPVDSSTKVGTQVKVDTIVQRQTAEEEVKETTTDQIGQIDASISIAQTQGETHVIILDKDKSKEGDQTPKVKE